MHISPTQEAGRALFTRGIKGPVVMVNLLRFREIADYSATPELAPAEPISGAEAFRRYVAHTLPHLAAAGGEIVYMGDGGPFLIGPAEERWDLALLVRHPSIEGFMGFVSNEDYMVGTGHRVAALLDARLLPTIELAEPVREAGA